MVPSLTNAKISTTLLQNLPWGLCRLNGCNLNSSWVDGTPEVGCKSTVSSSIAPAWSAESSASVQHGAWSMMWLLVYLLDLNKFPSIWMHHTTNNLYVVPHERIAEDLHPHYSSSYQEVSAGRRGVTSISSGEQGDPVVARKSAKSSSNACGNGIVRRKPSAFGNRNAVERTLVARLLVATWGTNSAEFDQAVTLLCVGSSDSRL